ncbi:hypothetical protein, variant 5 [Aphanomyces invadans]|uniref:Uncharacterized protein n=1 Tax=Aphanomyces invadans TaxID=157072 RepID=A0A024TXE3_9STRA|nr:hypothetical protein H310_08794 [Aphanomyces invadans]XP_008872891.1 hypothetical protein, variant 1 [Aphanomyces invadans]XP_008872892.1 hypothetical protein, variant 2 [Aphanomyces invadans]XP_008872893.1 hypothetical protein, variant 3 [Aphanomyces invadans]XP_008872894.1 hypothetical protein, variant 4 [Aphanomyces invadans]XP_008872895.1 hypothetical protein, variant 5 [Aphanomyces invadans]ETV98693.1 hypothetical protein H310_08794 [Aphanomyces invadans]ETV98694.1 hypothetical prote|eukprot:XP_008872890.1 hypothetical protein H310_08794 [Aphanomyces invadans]
MVVRSPPPTVTAIASVVELAGTAHAARRTRFRTMFSRTRLMYAHQTVRPRYNTPRRNSAMSAVWPMRRHAAPKNSVLAKKSTTNAKHTHTFDSTKHVGSPTTISYRTAVDDTCSGSASRFRRRCRSGT